MEVWKKVKGFENYEVSNYGNVKSLKYNKIRLLKQEKVKGYLRVSLSKENKVKRFQVHRLVAESFITNYLNKPCVNHINGIKIDNRVSNLEWATYSENEIHSYNYLQKKNHNRKLKDEQVFFIKNKAIKGKNGNIKRLAKKFKVDVTTIYNILKNKYYA